tara:strand:+ start:233 stop:832 length:600 start_codon:yes stop_codon:yes gene_type:complete
MSIQNILTSQMKNLYKKKYISPRDGNISFKPRNSDYFYITAGSVLKPKMTNEHIVKVFFNNVKTTVDKNSLHKPSRELNMHYYLQRNPLYHSEDIFVVHVHPPNSIAYMGVNKQNIQLKSIQDKFPEMNVGIIGKNVPFLEAGTDELAQACSDHLYTPYTMIGLKQHGTLSIGSDINEIVEHLETLEYYLDIYFKSTSM